MNELPEIFRAGADDWMFILFVIFAIVAQVLEANRKKQLATKKRTERPELKPSAPARPSMEARAPQQELDAFLKALGVERERAASEPVVPAPAPPPRPRPSPQPEPMQETSKPRVMPVSSQEKGSAEQDFKKRYSDAARVVLSEKMPENKAVSQMTPPSSSMVMHMRSVKMPTMPLGPRISSGQEHHATFTINLKNRNELRLAILNQSILGKPRALDPYQ